MEARMDEAEASGHVRFQYPVASLPRYITGQPLSLIELLQRRQRRENFWLGGGAQRRGQHCRLFAAVGCVHWCVMGTRAACLKSNRRHRIFGRRVERRHCGGGAERGGRGQH